MKARWSRLLGPALLSALWLAGSGVARAEPSYVLRFGSVAPDGTAWARAARASSNAIEEGTHGAVHIRWYFGGIAGDEAQMTDRMKREQLDGVASSGYLCQRLSRTMRVLRLIGVYQNRDEVAYVAGRLKPVIDDELAQEGFVNLGLANIGADLIFSRNPVARMADLQSTRLWIWDLDDVSVHGFPTMGVQAVPMPINQAYRAYEDGKIDGFIAVPSAAMAFQWSSETRYITNLQSGYVHACTLITRRALDALPLEAQDVVRSEWARGMAHLDDVCRVQDEQLLGGLFERQGLKTVPVSDDLRTSFLATALAARSKMIEGVVDRTLMQRVIAMLAELRANLRLAKGHK
jgi:TRAP-type C4-dicarboxylate transport system substrate-binding protein